MHVIRYGQHNTSETVSAIAKLIEDSHCAEIRLFATIQDPEDLASPYMRVVVRYDVPAVDEALYILMDEIWLTACAVHRYSEVQVVLDLAQDKPNVYCCCEPVPMTTALGPEEALARLLSEPIVGFSQLTRQRFFRQLSSLSESAVAALGREESI
ncbi:hypothetical protein [Achromobacter aloeverae]